MVKSNMKQATGHNELAEKAMLVSLNIGQWIGRKQDKEVSNQAQTDFEALPGSGTYYKSIVAKEALKAISSAIAQARIFHYSQTLPWTDDGYRILTSMNYLDYTEGMRKFKSIVQNNVEDFLKEYENHKIKAQKELGKMYKEIDYPVLSSLRHKFYFDTNVMPLPISQDFRMALQKEELEQLQAQNNTRVQEAINNAMQDVWQRLYDKINAVVEKLKEPDAIFRNSLIGNVMELVEMLPKLNLTDDIKLEEMRKEIEIKICDLNPQDLRDNKKERKEAAKQAQKILDQMSGFMG